MSHIMAVLSNEPVSSKLPSLLNLEDITSAWWSFKEAISCAVSTWKILDVLSMDAVAIVSKL